MEYMESKMQEQIEAGINERERCYNEITELGHLRDKYKELYESSMLAEATAKQYAEEVDKQNAALAAGLAALCAFRDEVVGVMNDSEGVWGWHKNHTIATWDELFPVVPDVETPQHHLRELRAEAVLDAVNFGRNQTKYFLRSSEDILQQIEQYAEQIRKGEVK